MATNLRIEFFNTVAAGSKPLRLLSYNEPKIVPPFLSASSLGNKGTFVVILEKLAPFDALAEHTI
jgi:hypothetical protein